MLTANNLFLKVEYYIKRTGKKSVLQQVGHKKGSKEKKLKNFNYNFKK